MVIDPQHGWIGPLILGSGSVAYYLTRGDGGARAKGILAVVFVATFGLLLVPGHWVYLFPLAQLVLCVAVFVMIFGSDWLMRSRRRWP